MKQEIDSFFTKSVALMKRELAKIDAMSKGSKELIPSEASKIITDYVRTLVLLQKNDRAENLETSLSKMRDEDLKVLAKEATLFLLKDDAKETA